MSRSRPLATSNRAAAGFESVGKRQRNKERTTLKTTISILALATAAALLSACGGGSASATNPPAAPAQPSDQTLPYQSSATPAAYATPGLAEAFDYLNRERLRCGFGAVKQNAALDAATKNHALYMVANPFDNAHFETVGHVGFTGVDPLARAMAQGYSTLHNEVIEAGVLPWIEYLQRPDGSIQSFTDYPYHAIRTDLVAPFHGMSLLSAAVDMGLAFEGKTTIENGNVKHIMAFFANMGRGQSYDGQMPAQPVVRTFPCDGTQDVLPALFGEWLPTGELIPGRNMNVKPTASPIYVYGEYGSTLSITSAKVVQISTGKEIPIAMTSTKATDVNHGTLFRESWAGFILPDTPFIPLQAYRVRVEGKSDAKRFVKEFTFTPGRFSVYDKGLWENLGLPTQ